MVARAISFAMAHGFSFGKTQRVGHEANAALTVVIEGPLWVGMFGLRGMGCSLHRFVLLATTTRILLECKEATLVYALERWCWRVSIHPKWLTVTGASQFLQDDVIIVGMTSRTVRRTDCCVTHAIEAAVDVGVETATATFPIDLLPTCNV